MKQIPSIDIKSLNLSQQMREFTRKVKEETLIRTLFHSFKHQIKGHPKKEYLRCKLIRFHKRANRKLKKGKKLYNNFIELSENSELNWQKLLDCYNQHSAVLDQVSSTFFEPIKFRKNAKPTCLKNRSFNSEFCIKYFEKSGVRESFYYFVEYLFSDIQPQVLAKVFGFSCCESEEHDLECAHKWLLMKRNASQFIVGDLGFKPWMPETCGNLPSLSIYYFDRVD
jgi:hypothetical protein